MKLLKKLFKFMCVCFFIFFVLSFSMYGYSRVSTKLEIKVANNVSLYDKDGNLFFTGNGNNEWIKLDKISSYLIDATISTEDKNFYDHFGFDIFRIMKAAWVNITSGKTKQGASTISQQYVKNLFLDFDKTWERKWNELWLTLNVELHYSKDEILEGYLNTINYGHGMYGIENASKFYFNKSAADLTLAESSILVGIPKSPSNYSPIINYELAKKRQKMVLENMVENGYITKNEMKEAYAEELILIGKNNIPTSFLDTGGLKIYTSLDLNAQQILEEKINKNLAVNENLQANAIMMNPNTGEIIALVGGRDYSKSQFNRSVFSYRQVGSVMKPILYYAALENGFTSSTCFTSEETTFTFSNNNNYSPKNANEVYGNRPISLAAAIAYSDNIYAVKTHIFLGEELLVNMSKRLGISSNMEAVPSLALGTSEINIIELTSAYSIFANEGYKVNPHLILKIEDSNGNILYEVEEVKESILNPSLVYILNNLLTSTYDASFIDYNYPTVFGISSKLSKKYSIKSGTTATDSWTVGYTPNVITSVWVGYDDSSPISTDDYMYTKNIFADTMETYLKDKEDAWYKMPNNVVGVLVDPISGLPANDNSVEKKVLYYLKGTEPTNEQAVFDEK